jgi:hypothetical protein
MEKIDRERHIDVDETRRLWQQLAIGTIIALAWLLVMGIGEAIARWLEGV